MDSKSGDFSTFCRCTGTLKKKNTIQNNFGKPVATEKRTETRTITIYFIHIYRLSEITLQIRF